MFKHLILYDKRKIKYLSIYGIRFIETNEFVFHNIIMRNIKINFNFTAEHVKLKIYQISKSTEFS